MKAPNPDLRPLKTKSVLLHLGLRANTDSNYKTNVNHDIDYDIRKSICIPTLILLLCNVRCRIGQV